MSRKLSFVIPCYKSEKTIEIVIKSIIDKVEEQQEYDYEIIAVNDCSPDHVMDVLRKTAFQNHKVKVLNLAGNVGKHAAVLAGYHEITGDYVINIDDDGQCPIDCLWELIEPLEKGHDMAMARYLSKRQSSIKNFGSWINDKMTRILLDKPAGLIFSNYIARQQYICKAMSQYTKTFPYLEGLSLRTTRDIVLVPMEEKDRISGASNYTFRKSLALWGNGLTAFSIKPLRIAALIGLLVSVSGFFYGIVTIMRKLTNPAISVGYSSILVTILFCAGIIMILLGVIGEYVGRIYISVNEYSQYVVKERINLEGQADADDMKDI